MRTLTPSACLRSFNFSRAEFMAAVFYCSPTFNSSYSGLFLAVLTE